MARSVMTGTDMALCDQARRRSAKVVSRGWAGCRSATGRWRSGVVETYLLVARLGPGPASAHHRPHQWPVVTTDWWLVPGQCGRGRGGLHTVHTRPAPAHCQWSPPARPPCPRPRPAPGPRPGGEGGGGQELCCRWWCGLVRCQCDSGHSSRGVVNTLGQTSPVSTVTCPPPPRPRPAPPAVQQYNHRDLASRAEAGVGAGIAISLKGSLTEE